MLSDYRDLDGLDGADSEQELDGTALGPASQPESVFTILGSKPALPPLILDFESLPFTSSIDHLAGFNGRCNKPADTCYSFWAGSTLAVSSMPTPTLPLSVCINAKYHHQLLGQTSLINVTAQRRYLLEKTQHPIGGFGKFPGELPGL